MRFLTRPAKPSDLNLVRSSWLKSYRREMRYMDSADYYAGQHARIERLLATSGVLVAHIEDAPDVVIGWLCCEPRDLPGELSIVHYAWTKRDWQHQGVLTRLLDTANFTGRMACTHLTRDWRVAVPSYRYLPYGLGGEQP